jgi:hypothetical protein
MGDNSNIYLCQVNKSVSCGACCGLYNLPDISRVKLENILSQRTQDFATVPRTEEGFWDYLKKHKGPPRLSRPFPQFHHCRFLGMIGEQNQRVGCLLHPAAPGNNGVDYRTHSWYGETACRTYFCPSTNTLSPEYQLILTQVIDDWYDFGLIVTEHALVAAYFHELERRLNRPVRSSDFYQNTAAVNAFREFVALKSSWPYRRHDAPGPCNFFFANGLYPRPAVFRGNSNIRQSRYEKILQELDSGFADEEELVAAEKLLDALFLHAEHSHPTKPSRK